MAPKRPYPVSERFFEFIPPIKARLQIFQVSLWPRPPVPHENAPSQPGFYLCTDLGASLPPPGKPGFYDIHGSSSASMDNLT